MFTMSSQVPHPPVSLPSPLSPLHEKRSTFFVTHEDSAKYCTFDILMHSNIFNIDLSDDCEPPPPPPIFVVWAVG